MNKGGEVRPVNQRDWVCGTFFTAQSDDLNPTRPYVDEPSNDTNTNTTFDCYSILILQTTGDLKGHY